MRGHIRRCVVAAAAFAVITGSAAGGAAPSDGDQLYRDGHYSRALEAWSAEAAGGDRDAAWRLAVALNDGLVVERDPVGAVRWLTVAAEAGHADAQVDLGTAYDRGEGVAASAEKAALWYRRAALQGHMAGQFNLASMYEQGEGVERDLVEAYAWYTLSVSGGIGAIGDEAVARLADQLTGDELSAGDARARSYRSDYTAIAVTGAASRPPTPRP